MKEIAHPGLSVALRQEARDPGDHSSSGFGDVIKRVFKRPDSSDGGKEEIQVTSIRPIDERDYPRILEWCSDPETQGHLVPLPQLPDDWTDKDQVNKTLYKLHEYYINLGEPEKITALTAENQKHKALAVVTIRWRGDPWRTRGHRNISSVERLVVNPNIRGKRVGSQLMDEAERIAFVDREVPEIRAWVMTDEKAGADRGGKSLRFFQKRGYDYVRGENYRWSDYAKKRGLGENSEGREGVWVSLKREDWEKIKAKQQPKQATLGLEGV